MPLCGLNGHDRVAFARLYEPEAHQLCHPGLRQFAPGKLLHIFKPAQLAATLNLTVQYFFTVCACHLFNPLLFLYAA
jgi:hypothetical protein